MTTKLIGVRQFTKSVSKTLKQSQEKNIHFIIMKHGEPIAHITPAQKAITNDESKAEGFDLEELTKDVMEARAEVARGETKTMEQVAKEPGIAL